MPAFEPAALDALIISAVAKQLEYAGPIAADTQFSTLGLDSIGVVILVAELETQIGFSFDPEDLVMTHFTDAQTLTRLLCAKYAPA